MVRIAGLIIVWATIAGVMFFYNETRQYHAETVETISATVKAAASVTIEVTATFSAEKDPFALDVPGGSESSPLILRLGDLTLIENADALKPGIPFIAGPLKSLKAGSRELYIEASPPIENGARHHALRIRIFGQGRLIAEKTFWAEPGGKITGVLPFNLKAVEYPGEKNEL